MDKISRPVDFLSIPRDVKLKSVESNLSFIWNVSKGTDDLQLSLSLSSTATNGSIYSVNVPMSIFKACFGHSRTLDPAIKEIFCYVVACNSGEVFIVDIYEGGSFRELCHSQGNIVWADFVSISECECLYLLERTGMLCIGTFNDCTKSKLEAAAIFHWQTISLSMSPICCIGMESSLIIADGHASYLCPIARNLKILKWECKDQILPFWGITELKKKELVVIMTACDGRQYEKTLLELNHLAKIDIAAEIPINLSNLSLSEALKATEQSSRFIKNENGRLGNINLYLEQISVAHLLLNNSLKNIFTLEFKIEPSLEKDGFYLLLLDLQFVSQNVKLKGPWWQLNIKLKDWPSVNYIYRDIHQLYNNRKARFHIYIPPDALEKLCKIEGDSSLSVMFNIVFCHFCLDRPILVVNVHQESFDLIHFLSLQRNDNAYDFPFPNFQKSIAKIFTYKLSNVAQNTLFAYHYKESILLFEKHLPDLLVIFPELCNANNAPVTTMLWLHNLSITLSCEKTILNTYKIILESSVKLLVIAVKIAIERRAFCNSKISDAAIGNITLPSEVLCKTDVCKLIVDLETANSPSQFVVKRLYESVHSLISSIPL